MGLLPWILPVINTHLCFASRLDLVKMSFPHRALSAALGPSQWRTVVVTSAWWWGMWCQLFTRNIHWNLPTVWWDVYGMRTLSWCRSKLDHYKKPDPCIWSPEFPTVVINLCISPYALCKSISRHKDVLCVKSEWETPAHQKSLTQQLLHHICNLWPL